MSESNYRPPDEKRPLLKLLRGFNFFVCKAYHHTEQRTADTVPATGPAIVCCNHTSALDPALIQACSRRLIVWMMAAEYYDVPAMRWFYETMGVIGVNRGQRDSGATRNALRVLAEGGVLGVFPEGRIARSRELLPFHPGAATLAGRSGVPIVPVAIDGTTRGKTMVQAVTHPQQLRIAFGRPIDVARRANVQQVTDELRSRVEGLLAEVRK